MTRVLSETQERFFKAIVGQIAPERIIEVHLFQPIRQGGMESGVAVVAAVPEGETVDETPPGQMPAAEPTVEEAIATGDVAEYAEAVDQAIDDANEDAPEEEALDEAPAPRPRRYTVYTANYRHVLKGPDRGKWETNLVAEADAPLLTVDVVVRGVLRRSGDATEPERFTGAEIRQLLRMPEVAA